MRLLRNILLILVFIMISSCKKDDEIYQNSDERYVEEIKYINSPKKLNVGDMAPNFILNPSNINEVKFSKFRNNVVVLYFGASWCTICKLYENNFLELVSNYSSKDAVFFKVFVDYEKKEFLEYKPPIEVDLYRVFNERNKDNLMGLFDVRYFPYFVIIDRDGIVRGFGNPLTYDFELNIETMLNE